MTRGRNICNQLKEVRKRIAEENGIPLEIEECTYTGECRGTCPRCEAEVRYLEDTLADRLHLGKAATVAGIALALAACGGGQHPQVAPAPTEGTPAQPQHVDTITDTTLPPPFVPTPEVPAVLEGMVAPDTPGLMIAEDDTSATTSPEPQPECTAWTDSTDLWEGGIEDELIALVETDPEFPGGIEALYKFLSDNIVYPEQAREEGIEGRVYVCIVVEVDGTVSNLRLLRDIGGGCGEEALRVVRMMPKWSPGKQQGKAARTQYNIPVNFTLQQQGKQ